MTQQDDITQPVLTDDEILATLRPLYADGVAAQMGAIDDLSTARAIESAVLSKLRAPVAASAVWKLVPVKPTPKMMKAWYDAFNENIQSAARSTLAYRAMILAAPAAPAGGAPVAGEAQQEIEQMAVNRYRAVPDGMFGYKVVAGDGSRSLYTGTKDSCLRVAAKLTEAFLDGAFVASDAAPQASAEDVRNAALEEAEEAVVTLYEGDEAVYLPDIALAIRALKQPQAAKDGCTCPSGDGSLRHPCAVHPTDRQQSAGNNCKHTRAYRAGDRTGYHCPDCGEFVSDYEIHLRRQRAALSATQPEQGERDE